MGYPDFSLDNTCQQILTYSQFGTNPNFFFRRLQIFGALRRPHYSTKLKKTAKKKAACEMLYVFKCFSVGFTLARFGKASKCVSL